MTRYELEPAPGTRSSRVISLSDDIARSMSAKSARVAVIYGKNAIGIELPNKNIEKVFLVLLVLDALALIGLVLLQQGKGADVGAAFGSGSSGTVFGSSGGANFLTRLTTFFAVLFFVLSFSLAYLAKERTQSSATLPMIELSDQENEDSETTLEVDNEEIPDL